MTFWIKQPKCLPASLSVLSIAMSGALLASGCVTTDSTTDIATDRTTDRTTGGAADIPATMAQSRFSAADEAHYMERFAAQVNAAIAGGGIGEYDPLANVAGAAPYRPLATGKARISATALQQATQFAGERQSSAFLVWHDGALVAEEYFNGADRDYLVNAKSLAKPITAILVGRAIAQGHITSLEQPVADYITEWQSDPQKSKILIRHLLDMRTGLLPQGFDEGPESVLNRAYLHPRHDEVIIEEYPLVNEPGTRYEYANANSELVAVLIQRATGQRYDKYLTDALLLPIGAQGGTIWLNRPDGTPHSGCCVQLPAQSYLRFGMLLLNDGIWEGNRLLPEGYVRQMRTASTANPHAGLGVWIAGDYIAKRGSLHPSIDVGRTTHSEPYADKDLFLFDGNGSQVVYIIPSQKMVIVRTGDRPKSDKPWDNSYLPNILINAIERRPGDTLPIAQSR